MLTTFSDYCNLKYIEFGLDARRSGICPQDTFFDTNAFKECVMVQKIRIAQSKNHLDS